MLKMTVSPLAIRNSSIPYSTPLRVDMTISSSTAHRLGNKRRVRPGGSGRTAYASNGYFGRSILQVVGSMVCAVSILAMSFQPQPVFSSSNGSFSVRFAERGYVHRLEELVIVLAHVALAAVEDFKLHAFERERDLDRIDRLGLVGGCRQHAHLVDGARVEQAEVVSWREAPFQTPATACCRCSAMPSPTWNT